MPSDAGSIYFHALSNLGQNIGRAIEQKHNELQQQRMFDTFVRQGSQIAIPGEPGKKLTPLISPQVFDAWTRMSSAEQARNVGGLEALQKAYQGLALTGAKARIQQESVIPIYDQSGRQIGERGARGGTRFFPEWVVTGGKKAGKTELEKGLAKHGLTPEDLQNVDEDSLKLLDANQEEIKPVIPTKDIKRKPGSREAAEGVKPQIYNLNQDAKFISGTAGGKEFQIPFKDWRRFNNMMKGGQDNVGEQARTELPLISTPDEARRLPPGSLFRRKHDGKILRVPARAAPAQASMDTSDTDTEDNGG